VFLSAFPSLFVLIIDPKYLTSSESMLDDELAEFRAANSREPSEDEMIGIENLVLFSKELQYVRLTQLSYISNFPR
jgi:hypothetical protein